MTARTPGIDGPIVVDANILFGALLREGTTRRLLLYGGLNLHTPETIWAEFGRNRAYLVQRSRAPEDAFDLLVEALRDRISAVPLAPIRERLREAEECLGNADMLDAPYVAAALALGAALWTHDKRLRAKAPVPLVSTADVVAALGIQ
jgi:predicted nucleic acid-binding protein